MSEQVLGSLERLEGRIRHLERVIPLLGACCPCLIEVVSTDKLLQAGLGVRKLVEGFDPNYTYSEVEWTSLHTELLLAQNYLRNAAEAVGGERFRRIFTLQTTDQVNENEKNYRAAALYNTETLSPVGATLADVKLEERRHFKDSLIRAVDTAYSTLQLSRRAQKS